MKTRSNVEVPARPTDSVDRMIVDSLAKLDGVALGISLALLFGLIVFAATNIIILKGGDVVGPNLALLGQFFIGYDVTFSGSIVGIVYGGIVGFILGWLIASLRNFVVSVYIHYLKVKGSMSAVNDYIDNP
ncbi:MAG TPA: hypothetical protein PKC65_12860 [Pyrinomonadaceae bacterium]|nr:hypothetical protein [Pyrinomonadaceae bacterium]